MDNVLKKFDEMKEKIENFKALAIQQRFKSIYKTMLSYCFECRKNTESKNPKLDRIKNGRIMILSK